MVKPSQVVRRRRDAVLDRLGAVLFGVAAAFVVDLRIAIETRGDLLLQSRVGQQIAGDCSIVN